MSKKIKPSFIVLVSVISINLFISCGGIVKSMANKRLTEENGAIPPDFGKENSTVIFITHHKSYNKYLKKNVKKIYKGQYEFVTEEDFELNKKYKNSDKYRYVFDYGYQSAGFIWVNNTINSGNSNIQNRPALYNVKKFTIVDRKTGEIYKSDMTSSFWSKLQKVYIKKLDEKRVSAQHQNLR